MTTTTTSSSNSSSSSSSRIDEGIAALNMFKVGVKNCLYCMKQDVCLVYLNLMHVTRQFNEKETIIDAGAIAYGCKLFVPIFDKKIER